MNKSKFIRIGFIVILISVIFLLTYGITKLREKRAEEKLFSYHQEKILDSSEKKELWFESEKNYASWESNGFLGAQYDVNWYNFSDYELYNWEIKIVIPEGSYLDSSWNGVYQIENNNLYISSVSYNEIIRNQVYPLGFILYIPNTEANENWLPSDFSLEYKRYLAMGDVLDFWVIVVFASLIVIAATIVIILKLKIKEAKPKRI